MSQDSKSQQSETRTTKAFYDRLSRAYDLLAEADEHTARERGIEALALVPGERVLEIGFGTGQGLVELAQAVGEDGQILGLELSEGMLEVAAERLEAAELRDRVELRLGDARELPWDDRSFDAVFLSFTLELFENDDMPTVLAETRRVLKAGGRLGVVSLESRAHENLVTDFYRWFHRHFPHIADCRPIPLTGILVAAGFRIETRHEFSIWGLPVAAVTAAVEEEGVEEEGVEEEGVEERA